MDNETSELQCEGPLSGSAEDPSANMLAYGITNSDGEFDGVTLEYHGAPSG